MNVVDLFLEKYGRFTEIQKKAMPVVGKGKNCVIIAPTGSGKTEAAMLPIINRIAKKKSEGISVLYITPLRALNRDLLKRLEEICKTANVTIGIRHGDTTPSERARQARRKPQILITTPETLENILPAKSFAEALSKVDTVVIDEIHELAGSKRGTQLSVALERLAWHTKKEFQRIGISATVGDAEKIARFLCGNRSCEVVNADEGKKLDIKVELPYEAKASIADAASRFEMDPLSSARIGKIIDYIKDSKSVLIFANTRQIVEAIGSRLTYIERREPFGGIGIHHSSLDRLERISIEDSFKNGKLKSVIATSSLELGIDIGNIDMVIQYGSPRQAVRLLQRVGRAGHTEKRTAKGVIISNSAIDALEAIAICDNVKNGVLEDISIHEGALDVLMHQLCGMLLERGKMKDDDAYLCIRNSYAYRSLERNEFDAVLAFMAERMLALRGKELEPTGRTRPFYYEHISFISDSKKVLVKDFYTGKIVSALDERFVESYIEEGVTFITKGLPWKVISIDENVITAEPDEDFDAAIPDWEGEDMPVAHCTAEKVYELFSEPQENKVVQALVEKQRQAFIPEKSKVEIEVGKDYKAVYLPLGTLANDALARILVHRLIAITGRSISVRSTPYMIFFELADDIDIKGMLLSIDASNIEELARAAAIDTDLFTYKFIEVAKFFGIIDKDAAIAKNLAKKIAKAMKDSPVYTETIRELMHNHFDIATLKQFFKGIKASDIIERYSNSISPFGQAILGSVYSTKELIMPLAPNSMILDAFMQHMLSKKIDMLCTYCGFSFTRKLEGISKSRSIECPSCGSPMIARRLDEYEEVVKKGLEKKKLSKKELGIKKQMLAEASLFNAYGGRAAVALCTYGIGDATAARVLRMFKENDRDFFSDLVEAQKQFVRTKKYWTVQ